MTVDVEVRSEDGVLIVTLNRPDKKNAISAAMYATMAEAVLLAQRSGDIGAVLLTGAGGNFTSGNDIGLFVEAEATGAPRESAAAPFLQAVVGLGKPLVACVSGHAVGIGATVLIHCDYVVATDDARIRFPFVDLGLCPEFASTLLLQQTVGRSKASEWLLLGAPIPAAEAQQAGLVNRVMPAALALEEATSVAKRLAAKPRQALAATRALIRDAGETLVRERLRQEAEVFEQLRRTDEAQRVFRRFFDRAPAGRGG